VVEPEEYASMSDEELMELIQKELYVNEGKVDGSFYHKKSAEYLERALYVCPHCGISNLESKKDVITCHSCGCQVRYLPTKELEGIGQPFPFRFVTEWYDYQCNFMNQLDLTSYVSAPMDLNRVSVTQVIPEKKKVPLLKDALLYLYGDRIMVHGIKCESPIGTMTFDEISAVTVLGRNKLNIYVNKTIYQFKGDKRFNALMCVNTFYRYKNMQKGDQNGKFLGL